MWRPIQLGLTSQVVSGAAWRELQTLLESCSPPPSFIGWCAPTGVTACFCVSASRHYQLSAGQRHCGTECIRCRTLDLPALVVSLPGGRHSSRGLFSKQKIDNPVRRTAIFVVWLLFLGARTFVRTFDWKDQRTFVERTIANGGDSARMLTQSGRRGNKRRQTARCRRAFA